MEDGYLKMNRKELEEKCKIGKSIILNRRNYQIKQIINGNNDNLLRKLEDEKGHEWVLKILTNKGKKKNSRFANEIECLKKIKNRNVIKLKTYGDFNGFAFYVMPFFSSTFRDIINENIDIRYKIKYFLQICEGVLSYTKENIVHRDIKPENILFSPTKKKVVISDFGIAKTDFNGTKTNKGDRLANFDYSAPEQGRKKVESIGIWTDIFALGLILNQIFTKRIPKGSNYKKISDYHPEYSKLDQLVDYMLESNTSKRCSDIVYVINEIKVIDGEVKQERAKVKQKLSIDKSIMSEKDRETFKQSVDDIIIAKHFVENGEINNGDLNLTYHEEIVYKCKEEFNGLLFLSILFQKIKGNFEYECNPISNQKDMIEKFRNNSNPYLEKLISLIPQDKRFLNYGELLRLFFYLKDYHAQEILNGIPKIWEEIDYKYCGENIFSISRNLVENKIFENLDGLELDDVICLQLSKSFMSNKRKQNSLLKISENNELFPPTSFRNPSLIKKFKVAFPRSSIQSNWVSKRKKTYDLIFFEDDFFQFKNYVKYSERNLSENDFLDAKEFIEKVKVLNKLYVCPNLCDYDLNNTIRIILESINSDITK